MNLQTPLNSALSVRDQFPAIPAGWHYLDSAATAQKPQAVIDAITRAYGHDYATVHRGVYERSAAMTASFEAARAGTASLIGGDRLPVHAGQAVFYVEQPCDGSEVQLECVLDDFKPQILRLAPEERAP